MTNFHVMQDAIAAAQRVIETGIPMSSDDIQVLARRARVPASTFAEFGSGGAATISKARQTIVVKARADGAGFDPVEDGEAGEPALLAIAKTAQPDRESAIVKAARRAKTMEQNAVAQFDAAAASAEPAIVAAARRARRAAEK